jgi:hypothetical protein
VQYCGVRDQSGISQVVVESGERRRHRLRVPFAWLACVHASVPWHFPFQDARSIPTLLSHLAAII